MTTAATAMTSLAPGEKRSPIFPKLRVSDHLIRAVLAVARAEASTDHYCNPVKLARQTWPGDKITPIIVDGDAVAGDVPRIIHSH